MNQYRVIGPGILLGFPGKSVNDVIDKVVALLQPTFWSKGAYDSLYINLNGTMWITLKITKSLGA